MKVRSSLNASLFQCILFIVVTLLLTSCIQQQPPPPPQPRFATRYDYSPPPDAQGKLCLINCQSSQNQCSQINQLQESQNRQNEAMQEQDCQRQAANYNQCVRFRGYGYCQQPSCFRGPVIVSSSQTLDCQAQYNLCYQTCGGTVTSKRECVANCGYY